MMHVFYQSLMLEWLRHKIVAYLYKCMYSHVRSKNVQVNDGKLIFSPCGFIIRVKDSLDSTFVFHLSVA